MHLQTALEPLSREELRVLAASVAADDSQWRHLVRHQEDARTYEELRVDNPALAGRVGLWLICWMNDHDTGFHDHDISSGAVAVAGGTVRDERLAIGTTPPARTYGEGESFDFGPSDIHRMAHAGGGPAISIHAYSPPLQRMGAYVVEPDGVLRRTPLPYSEELRPADAVVA
jgi:predicted metal-dependent enzyme (double-stranded beta helix superfamily)